VYQLTLALSLAIYAAAAAAAFAAFARPGARRSGALERGLTAFGFLAHGVAIGAGCAAMGGRYLLTGTGAVGLGAWIAAGALLLLQRTLRSAAPGVAVLPLIAAATLPGLFASAAPAATAGPGLAALTEVKLHVATAIGAVTLLVLAAAMGTLYLVQWRELKTKRFGPMLRRLPALGTLERVGAALLLAGVAAFTFALASGGLAARLAWCAPWAWDAQRIGALGAWLVFAALAAARALGVRGARQAVLSVGGLALVLAFLVGGRQGRADDPHAHVATSSVLACAGAR
jgi:HemX protein